MSRYIRRHISASHTVASVLGESLTVDGRTYPITDAISPRVSRSGRVAYKTHELGQAMVLERDGSTWLACALTAGHAPLAWDGEDLLIQMDNSGLLIRVRRDGSATMQFIGRYASEGIAKVENGVVILANERTGTKHGRMCWSWDEDEHGNLVCLSEAGHPDFGAVALWKADKQAWFMWVPSAHIQEPPYIVNGRVAISGWDTPEPDAVPWVPLTDPQPVPAMPPPVIVTPPTSADCREANTRADAAEQARLVAVVNEAAIAAQVRDLSLEITQMRTEQARLLAVEQAYLRIPRLVRGIYR